MGNVRGVTLLVSSPHCVHFRFDGLLGVKTGDNKIGLLRSRKEPNGAVIQYLVPRTVQIVTNAPKEMCELHCVRVEANSGLFERVRRLARSAGLSPMCSLTCFLQYWPTAI